jgi:TRAP-type C4-dicarboxylate transport system permease large subunit
MTTVLNGVLGGLLVGAIATISTRVVAGEASVTTAMRTRIFGENAGSSRRWDVGVQLSYGAIAGGALLVLELLVLGLLGVPPTASEALAVALAWSALLAGTVIVLWRVTASSPLDRSRLKGWLRTISSTESDSEPGSG